jgi:hypothetical protein
MTDLQSKVIPRTEVQGKEQRSKEDQEIDSRLGSLAHAYNLSYLGGRDQ